MPALATIINQSFDVVYPYLEVSFSWSTCLYTSFDWHVPSRNISSITTITYGIYHDFQGCHWLHCLLCVGIELKISRFLFPWEVPLLHHPPRLQLMGFRWTVFLWKVKLVSYKLISHNLTTFLPLAYTDVGCHRRESCCRWTTVCGLGMYSGTFLLSALQVGVAWSAVTE